VITGRTSGIGYRTALELAAHGTVVLVGRNADRLGLDLQHHKAVVVCSDVACVTDTSATSSWPEPAPRQGVATQ
jgi:NAD(P)-dependent dehydrogenase (short-subunit alcohol dehydrogenase family)